MNISLKKKNSIIVGGSGQLGFYLANELIKKKYHVIITTRNINKSKKKINIKNKNIKLIKLDVLKIKQIEKIINKYRPKYIFYFAGQSSPNLSFKKPKQTYLSNFIGYERKINPSELSNFEGCFLTGTAAEVTPVSCIAEYQFKVCDLIIDLNKSYQTLVRKKKAA